MSQPMPVVRQIYLPGLIPQALAIASLQGIALCFLPLQRFLEAGLIASPVACQCWV